MQQAVVYGVITGAVYGFVAIGLVLIYKSSGVFNFAQGEFGTVAVYFLYLAKTGWHLPYPIALLLALGVAVVMGLLTTGPGRIPECAPGRRSPVARRRRWSRCRRAA